MELNEKDKDGYYPLLETISNNNVEMVKSLIKYSNQHKVILELNKKNNDGY